MTESGASSNQLFDLFVSLDATDEQLNYTTLYASAREGWAVKDHSGPRKDMTDLFDAIIEKGTHTPPTIS